MNADEPVVLVVDDERELADLYAEWLEERWTVKTANDVDEAIERLGSDIDIALVDRRMPERSGDEFLEYVEDTDYDLRVGMVTAVTPDFDIVEMGFDEYVVKPVDREELHELVETLLLRSAYDETLRELYELVSKRASLESCKPESELEESERYAELNRRIEKLRSELESTVDSLSPRDFDVELRRIAAD